MSTLPMGALKAMSPDELNAPDVNFFPEKDFSTDPQTITLKSWSNWLRHFGYNRLNFNESFINPEKFRYLKQILTGMI